MTPTTRTRRGLRVLVLPAALAASGLMVTTALAAPPAAATRAASSGAGYIARHTTAAGGYARDVTSTAEAVLSLHAAGVGRSAATAGTTWLKGQLGAPVTTEGTGNAGRLALVILAARAGGADVRHFGGRAPANDLVTRLLATGRTTGPDAGLFGAQDPTYDGAYRQGLALAALKAAGVPVTNPKVGRGIGWLTAQQCANGLWQGYRASTSAPCPAADPATFAGPDTNSTGLAVQGLAAYSRLPKTGTVLASLRAVQSADGGFPFLAAPGQRSDPQSTALALQAVLAAGGDPASSSWTRGGSTPYRRIVAFQLGCSDPVASRGAFFYRGGRAVNDMVTLQVVPALAGKTLPLTPSTPSTAVPTLPC